MPPPMKKGPAGGRGPPEIFQASNDPASPTPLPAKIQAVYIGRTHIGFVRGRATGFEALDRNRRSLGVFPTMRAAAAAIPANDARPPPSADGEPPPPLDIPAFLRREAAP